MRSMNRTPLLMLAILLGAVVANAGPDGPEIYGEFDGDPMYTLLPPDGIPAIQSPEYLTGAAGAAQMSLDEPVMGLVATTTGDEETAICWSTWQLDRHEIVNDTFRGAAIAVTW